MIERPSNGRARISQDFTALKIEIPSRKNWFVLIFFTFWLGGWFMGESFAIQEVFNSGVPFYENAFLLFWLGGWTVGGAFVILTILWQLIGKEIIIVSRGILKIEKSIRFVGLKKSYDIASIKNLTINPVPQLSNWNNRRNSSNVLNSGKIQFDYGMKTIKFANDVEEAEARMLLTKLKDNTNFREEQFE
jgi:hypothetical protein